MSRIEECPYESKFLFLNEKRYYIRKKIVSYLLKNNLVSDKQDLRDFILGNCWGIDVEDYIIYRGGTFHFKDRKNASSFSWIVFDGQVHLSLKPKEIQLPSKTLNTLFTNYFEPTPEECTLFELEYGFKWLFDPTQRAIEKHHDFK